MIVWGVDPDSGRHGVAMYEDGKLVELANLTLMDIILHLGGLDCLFSIENVLQNKFVYARNEHNKKAQSNIAMKIGRCQQAQIELMRALDYYNIPYVLHAPQKGNWAKNKALFEKVTGWNKRSNEDTRSAAYFGWLVLK